jgi:hypothetical protein
MYIPRFAKDWRLAVLAALLLIPAWPAMSRAELSPWVCLVVKPPDAPAPNPTPPTDGGPHIASISPEPTSVVSGLLGSGLAGLLGWLRKRRAQNQVLSEDELLDEQETELLT